FSVALFGGTAHAPDRRVTFPSLTPRLAPLRRRISFSQAPTAPLRGNSYPAVDPYRGRTLSCLINEPFFTAHMVYYSGRVISGFIHIVLTLTNRPSESTFGPESS